MKHFSFSFVGLVSLALVSSAAFGNVAQKSPQQSAGKGPTPNSQGQRPQPGGMNQGSGGQKPHHQPKFCKEEAKKAHDSRKAHGLCVGKVAREAVKTGSKSSDCTTENASMIEATIAVATCVKSEREAAKASGEQPAPQAEQALTETVEAVQE